MNKARKRVMALIKKHSLVHPALWRMVLSICPLYLNEASLITGIKAIALEHTASSLGDDDDEHWVAKSPFNGKYYHFAGSSVCIYPTKPTEITDFPPVF